jgi:D-alanine-D-alanine ligase
MPEKTRVAVLYGGRSSEHEVSLQSAASVIRHLDRERFLRLLLRRRGGAEGR